MKKGKSSDKNEETKPPTKSLKSIKFHLSDFNLACFKSNNASPMPKSKTDSLRDYKWTTQQKTEEIKEHNLNHFSERKRTLSTNSFTEKVVIMQYDNFDVYIDNSTRKKSNSNQSNDSKSISKKSESESGSQDEFLESCVRVITEETDHTSHQMSMSNYQITSPYLTPRSFEYDPSQSYYLYEYEEKAQSIRNKRSVTNEESKAYVIDYDSIEREGRTTIMIKNIPNKYTQEMLLEEFQDNYENKFDFFYLPIDKDVKIMENRMIAMEAMHLSTLSTAQT